MPLEFAQCQIRTPSGPERADLYRMLGETFAPDRELFHEMLRTGQPMYTWTPYTLCRGREILGNVSLVPMRVWVNARPVEVVGVGSVATAPQYRRRGVARYLLSHCLGVVDQQRLPAVLFTGQPEVYVGSGFTPIPQACHECRLPDWQASGRGPQCTWLDTLTADDWASIAAIYEQSPAPYDGQLLRDSLYWEFYQTLFRLNRRWHIVACRDAEAWLGYARCEEEDGRLLISEFCAQAIEGQKGHVGTATNGSPVPPAAAKPCRDTGILRTNIREEVAESLLGSIVQRARQLGRSTLSLALAPGHFLPRLLRSRGVELEPEGPDSGRETFMARPAAGEPLGPLGQLQWPLADKF